jgi:low affinity Fe/Cu permease
MEQLDCGFSIDYSRYVNLRGLVMKQWFDRFATACGYWLGHPASFAVSLALVLVWAASGPLFAYSDTWQLVCNTGTTVVSFLMLFVIQHTQNRDTLAINVKLDEIVLAKAGARDEVAGVEARSEDEIEGLRRR